MKARSLSHSLNVGFVARQKVPSRVCTGPVVSLHICLLLRCRQLRRLARIKTDRNHFELLAGVEGNLSQRSEYSIQNLIAEHRARVVNERENDGLAFRD